jgi:hypothetical protein
MLPPLLDTDSMRVLGPRGAECLDPLVRRVSIFRAFLHVFAGAWVRQAIFVAFSACAMLGSPVGTNRLLGYIERSGADETVRPWVWITLIGLAPLAQSATDQLYLYYNTRTAAQMEAMVTGAIARHALRVRVLNTAEEEKQSVPASVLAPVPVLPKPGAAAMPREVNEQALGAGTVHSHAESSTTTTTLVAPANSTAGGKSNGQGPSVDGKSKKDGKTRDVVGRLNVLVTADLRNITDGMDWIRCLFSTALQTILGSWFVLS